MAYISTSFSCRQLRLSWISRLPHYIHIPNASTGQLFISPQTNRPQAQEAAAAEENRQEPALWLQMTHYGSQETKQRNKRCKKKEKTNFSDHMWFTDKILKGTSLWTLLLSFLLEFGNPITCTAEIMVLTPWQHNLQHKIIQLGTVYVGWPDANLFSALNLWSAQTYRIGTLSGR